MKIISNPASRKYSFLILLGLCDSMLFWKVSLFMCFSSLRSFGYYVLISLYSLEWGDSFCLIDNKVFIFSLVSLKKIHLHYLLFKVQSTLDLAIVSWSDTENVWKKLIHMQCFVAAAKKYNFKWHALLKLIFLICLIRISG